MKLELGKCYVTNEGKTVKMGPMRMSCGPASFKDENVKSGCGYYNSDGCYTFENKSHHKSIKREATEVETALYVLQQAGDVKFTPKFSPIEVPMTAGYKAVITLDKVTIGCHSWSLDAFIKVHTAIDNALDAAAKHNLDNK